MTTPWAARLAWSIWACTVLCLGLGIWWSSPARDPAAFAEQVLFGLAFLPFPTVGALIASRRPDNPVGWVFCAVALVFLGAMADSYATYALITRPGSLPGGEWMAWLSNWIGNPGFNLIFTFALLLFPNGKLLSPRWRPVAWLAATWITVDTIGAALAPGPVNETFSSVVNPVGVAGLDGLGSILIAAEGPVIVCLAALSLASVLLRFRRARAELRQQLKWFAYSGAVLLGVVIALTLLDYIAPGLPGRRLIGDALFALAVAGIPVSIGFAILRHRLFDIDLLIRRTLVYSVLSASLALIYFGSVVLLQGAVRVLAAEGQNQLITVLSTLAIAALFFPMRQRVQDFIDRRFYRRKYDAARVLSAFGAAARNETDLGALTARLVDVVNETMQPESVGLWLRAAPKRKEQHE